MTPGGIPALYVGVCLCLPILPCKHRARLRSRRNRLPAAKPRKSSLRPLSAEPGPSTLPIQIAAGIALGIYCGTPKHGAATGTRPVRGGLVSAGSAARLC
ncbi:MAG: hypothetical protein EBT98_11220 [Opitutaceae bacterium]|nr:hypothetical protein [Opitutaceae bacterium]